jgi:hypothetical protein
MKVILYTLLFALLALSGRAQCHYILDMSDSYGDGWNGARLDVTMNGVFVGSYECFGSSTIDSVYSFSGAQMDFTFYSGNWDSEITFSITDPQGNILYNGPAPSNLDNILHTSNSTCPPQSSCVNPVSLNAYNITLNSADISWNAGSSLDSLWNVEWGLSGFTQGSGTLINGLTLSNVSLNGLNSFTQYDFYVQTDCDSNGLSIWSGPYSFMTNSVTGSCGSFQVALNDQYGDGWNGGSLDIEINGVITQTITLLNGAGPETTSFPVDSGEVINLIYNAGGYPEENWYEVYDHNAVLLYTQLPTASGGPPSTYGLKACATCLNPSNLSVTNTSSNSADLQWNTTIAGNLCNVEWGVSNFILGSGSLQNNINSSSLLLTNLNSGTAYDFYVQEICGANDNSSWEGPFTFSTIPSPGSCGMFEIILTDSYGDGWNGGYINITKNNVLYSSVTLLNGSGPESTSFPVDSGDIVNLVYSPGDWPEENTYEVYDNNNILVAAESGSVNNGPNSTYNLRACESLNSSLCGTYTLQLFDTYGNGWNNGYLDVEINGNVMHSSTLSSGFGPEITPITLDSGDVVNLIYNPPIPYSPFSAFDGYQLLDPNGITIVQEISNDSTGPPSSLGIIACHVTSSISDNSIGNIKVYPNPTNKIVNINSDDMLDRVSLYNSLGKLIYDSKISSTKHQIDISRLQPNVYILMIYDNGNMIVEKIIIN